MQVKEQASPIHKTLYRIMLLVVYIFTFTTGNLTYAHAQSAAQNTSLQISGHVLSNGQFVYGPNIGEFNLKSYLQDHAPHLVGYADDLYARSEYYSINPKVYLTLLEIHGRLISNPSSVDLENPFGLSASGFIPQIEAMSDVLSDAYYLHLYSYSALPVTQRTLPTLSAQDGALVNVAPETNAATYAIIAALLHIQDRQTVQQILDHDQPNGFDQTYGRLFGKDDPLDETNHIFIPGERGELSLSKDSLQSYLLGGANALTAPDDLLQLPYLRGQSWFFGGVHSNGSGGLQSPFTDASALDFGPGGVAWGGDTSNMWVVASAAGIPTKISDCYVSILHGNGWETTYYHIENIQNFSGSINQNDKIGVIANTLAEATCSGGSSTGPHVHFNLKHNGALVAIDGTALSGWYVHAGRWNYDTDPNYMWLERGGIKKYANINPVLNEVSLVHPTVVSSVRDVADPDMLYVKFVVTFSESVTGVDAADFALTTVGITDAVISEVSGSGTTYTVTVDTGSGNGTIRLDVVDNDSILSKTGLVLGGSGLGNGNFTTGETYTITKNYTFRDVLTNHPYFNVIEILYANGYTAGCMPAPLNFCPDMVMNRAQAAVFMMRGNFGGAYLPPSVPSHFFLDNWTNAPWAETWAEAMYTNGLTGGCSVSPLKFCPYDQLTNAQAAVFGLRLKYGLMYAPAAAVGTVFADMTDPNDWATAWAEQAYADGLIPACGTSDGEPIFCPNALVSRGGGASIIVKAKGLTMP